MDAYRSDSPKSSRLGSAQIYAPRDVSREKSADLVGFVAITHETKSNVIYRRCTKKI